jgi:hypothetical protein
MSQPGYAGANFDGLTSASKNAGMPAASRSPPQSRSPAQAGIRSNAPKSLAVPVSRFDEVVDIIMMMGECDEVPSCH